jgi:chemotaxis protein MotB
MGKPHKTPHARHKRHAEHEEHDNHERWLVSYADMVTLLFVLFVVLFAMSQVDQKKFTQLADGLAKGFGAPSVAFTQTGETIKDGQNEDSPVNAGAGVGGPKVEPGKPKVSVEDQALKDAMLAADRAKQQRHLSAAKAEVENFEKIKKQILDEMTKAGMADAVRFTIDERGLVVTIVTNSVVFEGDRADLLPAGRRILDGVAPAIGPLPNRVQVDGHTNQLPVPTVNYPSAWELSTARASTVVRYLVERGGVAPARLSAAGYAGERPLYPASDRRAVELNRRVEIVVLSALSADERALLPAAAGQLKPN